MSRQNKKILTERQELLLCRYFDGECGVCGRYAAKSLLAKNEDAREFLERLSTISNECQDARSRSGDMCGDLWERISTRIESEERAAFYLGTRREEPIRSGKGILERFYSSQVLMGGLSGAAVAALALVLVTRTSSPTEILTVPRGAISGSTVSSDVTQVALGGANPRRQSNPGVRTRAIAPSMEVDWMRANGPLALIQNPQGKSAIIWVRRKPTAAMRNARQPAPAVPTMQAMLEQGLDGSPLNQSK
jgi:hypothetical protein